MADVEGYRRHGSALGDRISADNEIDTMNKTAVERIINPYIILYHKEKIVVIITSQYIPSSITDSGTLMGLVVDQLSSSVFSFLTVTMV